MEFLEILFGVAGWFLDVWFWAWLYGSRHDPLESSVDRLFRRQNVLLLFAIAGTIALVAGTVSLYYRHFHA